MNPAQETFACALATDCGESALVMNSDENARRSHAEPTGATERQRLTLGSHPPPTLLPEESPW